MRLFAILVVLALTGTVPLATAQNASPDSSRETAASLVEVLAGRPNTPAEDSMENTVENSAEESGEDDVVEAPAPSLSHRVVLLAPTTGAPWAMHAITPSPLSSGGNVRVQARRLNAPVYANLQRHAGRGIVREGTTLSATRLPSNDNCPGTWFRLADNAYVCSSYGWRSRVVEIGRNVEPDTAAAMPYQYGLVTDRDAYRFEEIPTQAQLDGLARGRTYPSLAERLDGDYFITLLDQVDGPGGPYWRTVAGRYVAVAVIEPIDATALHGEYAAEGLVGPLAFVHHPESNVCRYDADRDRMIHLGVAQKYARFRVSGEVEFEGTAYILGPDNLAIRRTDVRVVQFASPPSEVPAGAQWIHVNLDEQTLVAYEGERPVLATIIASGKEGYDTPDGVYRIRHKYLSITMSGDDPTEGVYDVAEVPWTMYYSGNFALHGAYWHDEFGGVRSHGCTNIAPTDARFLFGWTTPNVPDAWHGVREEGTWVWLTRD